MPEGKEERKNLVTNKKPKIYDKQNGKITGRKKTVSIAEKPNWYMTIILYIYIIHNLKNYNILI